jgi:hypothetical protein
MVRGRWRLLGAGVLAIGTMAVAQAPQDAPPGMTAVPDPPVYDDPAVPIVNDGFAGDEDIHGSIAPLVEALRSPRFSERETASMALLRLPPRRLPDVVRALAAETDAEAIERLTQTAAHLYLKPRTLLRTKPSLMGLWFEGPSQSMLGVKFKMDPVKLRPEDAAPAMTVMVTEIQVGFPAMQSLRNGDRIVAIGGTGFPDNLTPDDSDYFRTRVAALWPGGVVAMSVLRDGRLLQVDVQVAGLPVDGPSSPTTMVNLRAAALEAFLRSLKTTDKSQAWRVDAARPIPQTRPES